MFGEFGKKSKWIESKGWVVRMGRIEEVVDPDQALNEAVKLKDAGNEAFKKQQWEDAIKCYTKAIGLVPEESKDKAVFLKNRAASYLKTEQFEDAVSFLRCD